MKLISKLILAGVATLLISACASVSVKNVNKEVSVTPLVKPDVIYILPFQTAPGEFNVDRTGAELADFKQNLQLMLSTALVTEFPLHLAPSRIVSGLPPRSNAWVVSGQFIRVNQGSRLLRTTIGFGAGGTKMETRVFVYNLAAGSHVPPFLTFETTGGSGAEPGMLGSMDPVSLALSGVAGAAKGLSDDTKRTARMITATLSDYMYKQGWISKEQKLTPKMQE